jgi:hypothetical protein
MEQSPAHLLRLAYEAAQVQSDQSRISDSVVAARIQVICRTLSNRACVRFVLATTLAKAHQPALDIRKPYTEIGDPDAYSGRSFDEKYLDEFIIEHELPCNPTTAFLTPAFRNRNTTLTPDSILVGRPPHLYQATLQLLTDIQTGQVSAFDVLVETLRIMLLMQQEANQQIRSLLSALRQTRTTASLSAEATVRLIEQHLTAAYSSRLPVLIVAAIYQTAQDHLGEHIRPLQPHNAADSQTGAVGDIEIAIPGDDQIGHAYEMKTRPVTKADIDRAVIKVRNTGKPVEHYVFITTESIDLAVQDYAASIYAITGTLEVVVLDCVAFLRHFLHLFHRLRGQFLDHYQNLLLAEPNSAVDYPLKVAFLALRQAAETQQLTSLD